MYQKINKNLYRKLKEYVNIKNPDAENSVCLFRKEDSKQIHLTLSECSFILEA